MSKETNYGTFRNPDESIRHESKDGATILRGNSVITYHRDKRTNEVGNPKQKDFPSRAQAERKFGLGLLRALAHQEKQSA